MQGKDPPRMRPSRDNRMGSSCRKGKGQVAPGEKRISQGPEMSSDFAQQHGERALGHRTQKGCSGLNLFIDARSVLSMTKR